jgi:hypothetical protein
MASTSRSGAPPTMESGLASSEAAVQSAPASSGSRHCSPRNKATKALTHCPHCATTPAGGVDAAWFGRASLGGGLLYLAIGQGVAQADIYGGLSVWRD